MTKKIITGVLLLDKPKMLSSQQALTQAKRLFYSKDCNSKKAGHTGTLDPMATGLLPICFGEATKFSQYGLEANKAYEATLALGMQTDTADAQGQVVQTQSVPDFDNDALQAIAQSLIGAQQQIPPMYSALKQNGQKLYELARQGVQVVRNPRDIVIHSLMLHKQDGTHIRFSVNCSKGTYVRVLGEQIAKALGTVGHLSALRRTQAGAFLVDNAITLEALEKLPFSKRFEYLHSADFLLQHLPMLALDEDKITRLRLGQRLNVYDFVKHHAFFTTLQDACTPIDDNTCHIRLYQNRQFIGIAKLESTGRLQPLRLMNKAVDIAK